MSTPGFLPSRISKLFQTQSDAAAVIAGTGPYSRIKGKTEFYQTKLGVVAATYAMGLPSAGADRGPRGFSMRICAGNHRRRGENDDCGAENFSVQPKPETDKHPPFTGFMPPLFAGRTFALSIFLTDYFSIRDILGLFVVVYNGYDVKTAEETYCGEIIADGLIIKTQGE